MSEKLVSEEIEELLDALTPFAEEAIYKSVVFLIQHIQQRVLVYENNVAGYIEVVERYKKKLAELEAKENDAAV